MADNFLPHFWCNNFFTRSLEIVDKSDLGSLDIVFFNKSPCFLTRLEFWVILESKKDFVCNTRYDFRAFQFCKFSTLISEVFILVNSCRFLWIIVL